MNPLFSKKTIQSDPQNPNIVITTYSKSTTAIRESYQDMVELLSWMPVNAQRYWLGLDHIIALCDKIDQV